MPLPGSGDARSCSSGLFLLGARYTSQCLNRRQCLDTAKRPCRKCKFPKRLDQFHNSSRHKDGKDTLCTECQAERMPEYREAHREELRLKSAEYFATHREQHRRTMNAYDAAHREERRAYYHIHKEETNLRRRLEYATNPAKVLQRSKGWRVNNKDKIKISRSNRTEQIRRTFRQWYESHQEQILASRMARREEKRISERAWRKAHPERMTNPC